MKKEIIEKKIIKYFEESLSSVLIQESQIDIMLKDFVHIFGKVDYDFVNGSLGGYEFDSILFHGTGATIVLTACQ